MGKDKHNERARFRVLTEQVAELHRLCSDKDEMIRKLQHQLTGLLKRQYGQRAERVDPNQLLLQVVEELMGQPEPGEQSGAEQSAQENETAEEDPSAQKPPRKGHGRRRIPDHIERRRELHDLCEEQKSCECGRQKKCIGEEISYQYEYVPARLMAVEHVRKKYACVCQNSTVSTAAKPSSPIEKGLAAPSLIAHLAISKYLDHVPLNRQQGILARHGIDYAKSTMWGQIAASAELMDLLYQAAHGEVLLSDILGTDDTPVKIYDRNLPKTRRGYVWTYVGDQNHPLIVYDYTANRSRAGPEAFLEDYSGHLQADAYPAYDKLYQREEKRIWEIGCWSHARRYYVEAQETAPELSTIAVAHIKVLYELEKQAARRGHRAEALVAWRKEHALPVLDGLHHWLLETYPEVLPKSPIAKAMHYTLTNWDALCRYIENGDFVPDNNRSERALRGIALGRCNWMFFGSDRGGKVAAIMLTLLKSAPRNELNPFDYLTDVLTRIADHPRHLVAELLPHNWKPLCESELNLQAAGPNP